MAKYSTFNNCCIVIHYAVLSYSPVLLCTHNNLKIAYMHIKQSLLASLILRYNSSIILILNTLKQLQVNVEAINFKENVCKGFCQQKLKKDLANLVFLKCFFNRQVDQNFIASDGKSQIFYKKTPEISPPNDRFSSF